MQGSYGCERVSVVTLVNSCVFLSIISTNPVRSNSVQLPHYLSNGHENMFVVIIGNFLL